MVHSDALVSVQQFELPFLVIHAVPQILQGCGRGGTGKGSGGQKTLYVSY
jgi:hypothetical protein